MTLLIKHNLFLRQGRKNTMSVPLGNVSEFFEILSLLILYKQFYWSKVMIKIKRKRSDLVLWQKPCPRRNVKRTKWQHKQRHKKFDYTAIANRLRTVSWSNCGHPTGVVNRFTGQMLILPRDRPIDKSKSRCLQNVEGYTCWCIVI